VPDAEEPLRVVVVDDHPVYRDGLAVLLGSVPGLAVVGTAADGAEAVALAREEQPDVVVMDVQMPVLDGIEATRRITTESPSVGVVVLTMSEDDGTVFAAVRAGARGYLLKGADQEEVVRAITTVAGGGAVFGAADRRVLRGRAERAGDRLPAADRPRTGGARAGRRRAVQRPDRRRALPVAEDGAQQRLQRADEAAGHRPGAGDRAGPGGGSGAVTTVAAASYR
jgi:DNA-binding NarL/FixJ family response regulator